MWKADRQLCWSDSAGSFEWRPSTTGAHQQARQFSVAIPIGRGSASGSSLQRRMAKHVSTPGDAARAPDRQSSDGTQARRESVLDVASAEKFSAVSRNRFVRGIARNGVWCEVDHRNTD